MALHDAVSAVLGPEVTAPLELKWPNDLMAGAAKLSGILVEADPMGQRIAVAVGIGVNVVSEPPGAATSLARLGSDLSADELFARLDPALEHWLGIWDDGRGFGLIREAWLARGPAPGTGASVRIGPETLDAAFAGLADDGALLLEMPGGAIRRVAAGEVMRSGHALDARDNAKSGGDMPAGERA